MRDRGWGGGLVGKSAFVKHDVTGNNNMTSGEIVASVPLMLEGIAQKNAASGAWGEFVVGGGI